MARSNAVAAVTGELFEEGWSKLRGSTQGLGQKRQQMIRAAAGHHAAVFKAIRTGGTHTRSQLMNQLEYLTTKSSHIVDSRGVLDGKTTLSADEINSVADRFTERWDRGFNPKMGHTTHMLMSFPIGTRGSDVRDIASGVCERFFAAEGRTFDFLIAVHEDRAHPHAHVVLNRRSQEGEFFFLGRDHHFNYDDFRLAMVEEAEKYGVCLEATRRIDRGVVTYAPRTNEVYAAKEEGRVPVGRARVGRDLDRALAEIATTAKIYRSLAAEASAENREDISNALFRAGEFLARSGQLQHNGEIYVANEQSFDDLKSSFAERMERVEAMVANTPEAQRPQAQARLHDIYREVAHMQPLGIRSQSLLDAPSADGVYSETNINRDALDRLREPDTRAQIETALRGTGISSETIIARMETTANNAALEREWLSDDLRRIAETDRLNLERREDLQQAADRLDQVHVHLGTTLQRADVLREDGVIEDRFTLSEAHTGRVAQFATAAEAGRAFADANPAMRPRVSERVEDGQRNIAGTVIIGDQVHKSAPSLDMVRNDPAHFDAGGRPKDALGRSNVEFWTAYHEREDEKAQLRDSIAHERSPEIARVIAHERTDKINPPFADEAAGATYRAEIERELDDAQIEALRKGDADALETVIDDLLERLYAAKAYLQSDAATANSDATREVISEINDEEYEAQRLRHVHRDTDKGPTHG